MLAVSGEAAAAVRSAGGGQGKKEALTQQAKEKLSEREETNKDNFGNPECNKIRTMDLKFNNSRKYISITVPSKTQTMSPHIKSIDDIVVLGINLSKFNKLAQFFICVAGVFVFYLIYGYLQELIFSVEGFKSYGWYLTLVQFAFYSIFGLIELQLTQDKRRRIPGKTYMIIAFLTVGTMGLSNTSLGYLNYPTQVIFKCCKLIPVMLGGVFIQGKRYNVADVSAAVCMSLGLVWFTLADSTIAPNFNLTGVMLISLALCADAVIGNVQEKAMKLHNASNSEMQVSKFAATAAESFYGRIKDWEKNVSRKYTNRECPVLVNGLNSVIKPGFVFVFNRFCVHFIGLDMH
nr:adenosine 3'-phospho 5'-phosphosulfate transporter 2 isoform X3 [Oryctolagus cuniculus]